MFQVGMAMKKRSIFIFDSGMSIARGAFSVFWCTLCEEMLWGGLYEMLIPCWEREKERETLKGASPVWSSLVQSSSKNWNTWHSKRFDLSGEGIHFSKTAYYIYYVRVCNPKHCRGLIMLLLLKTWARAKYSKGVCGGGEQGNKRQNNLCNPFYSEIAFFSIRLGSSSNWNSTRIVFIFTVSYSTDRGTVAGGLVLE